MTYLYETIPQQEGDSVEQFEIQQSMQDLPLTHHPETGVPVRRVILGGWGLMTGKGSTPPASSGRCTPGGGCC
jgi:predicted nucleic acid-binding Zn ribbon protein